MTPEKSKISKMNPIPMEKDSWIILNMGFLLALMIYHSPFLLIFIYPLMAWIHEIGHAVSGWLFGYPSLPIFDFEQGNGMTFHGEQNIFVLILIYMLFLVLLFFYRSNPLTFNFLLISGVSHSVLLFTNYSETLILLMGHGSELLAATLLLYLAILTRWRMGPFYAMVGFFIVMYDLTLAYKLMYDQNYQKIYAYQQGGLQIGDLSRLALKHFDNQLHTVARIFFWCCFFPPLISIVLFRYQEFFHDYLRRQLYRKVIKN